MARRSNARRQYLDDILTTALEGGIGYWSTCSEYNYDPLGISDVPRPHGIVETTAVIHEWTDEVQPGPALKVNWDVISRGLRLWQESKPFCASAGEAALAASIRTNGEEGDYDASDADCIVQLGLFGEVRYG